MVASRRAKWKGQSFCPVLKSLGEDNEETWDEERISLRERSLGCSQPCPPPHDDAEHRLASAHNFLLRVQQNEKKGDHGNGTADSFDNVELPKHRKRGRPRLFAEYEIDPPPPAPIGTIKKAAAAESLRLDSLVEGAKVSQENIVMERVSVALEHSSKILNRYHQRRSCLLKLLNKRRTSHHQAVVKSFDSEAHCLVNLLQ
ncbi:unnamed protein product [Heterosigma akashiwo]|mmetsp:Transcript_3784/g.5278  ORF Transcript_3784/g.5278 Transcript_3784/m.5278 type:complete len:201 (-) Transcript_3784:3-605(-)